jgi:hypothetical protein
VAKSKSAKTRAGARSGAAGSASRAAGQVSSRARSRASSPNADDSARQGAVRVRYSETRGREWGRTLLFVGLFLCSVVVAFTVIEPRRGALAAVLVVLVSLWTLVAWHNRAYAYRCANCRRIFQVPTLVNFLSFQGIGRRPDGTYRGWKSLTCPYCHQRTKATVVRKVEASRKRHGSPGSDARLLR